MAKVAGLHGVTAAVGGLSLTDNQITISSIPVAAHLVHRVRRRHVRPKLGPLSDAALTSGRVFTASDADKNVALVDKSYATSNGLKVGKTMKIGGVTFTIVGLVTQPEGSNPPNVYIPLARAQAIATNGPGAAVT